MPSYVKLDDGSTVTATDEKRGVWYGMCGYWTDDWDKLTLVGSGIPACPTCQVVGMQEVAKSWFDGAKKFEEEDHPRYVEFLEAKKETCFAPLNQKWMEAYEDWISGTFEMVEVQSGHVEKVGYNEVTGALRVQFAGKEGSRIYQYDGVPPPIHKGLMGAESVGGYLAEHVKGSYEYSRVDLD